MMVLKCWELGTHPIELKCIMADYLSGHLFSIQSLLQQTEDFREVSYSSTWVSNKNSCTFGEPNLALKVHAKYMLEALFLLISHNGNSSQNPVPISSHTAANIFDRYLYFGKIWGSNCGNRVKLLLVYPSWTLTSYHPTPNHAILLKNTWLLIVL